MKPGALGPPGALEDMFDATWTRAPAEPAQVFLQVISHSPGLVWCTGRSEYCVVIWAPRARTWQPALVNHDGGL